MRGRWRWRTSSPLDVQWKADASPVTIADRAVERVLRVAIASRFPGQGILGEEEAVSIERELLWVVDPIDGTKSFISGLPLFGTLVAVAVAGRPQVGVIEMPALGERFVGATGEGTRFNGTSCRTSGVTRLCDARLCPPPPICSPASRQLPFLPWRRGGMRRFGGDCYAYGLLSCGHVDLAVEASLKPYDFMAPVPVGEGAGGVITDWNGAPLKLSSGGRVMAAANGALHAEALALLSAAFERLRGSEVEAADAPSIRAATQ
ncbi:inositol monophosphatase family protein [Xanthobacter flavus]|uniref:inositol monophosphatase family protein n=1 Tax=Xanthobacter flavus TaxID=281 RepID=UPI0037273BA5